jgi:hypothetical protein
MQTLNGGGGGGGGSIKIKRRSIGGPTIDVTGLSSKSFAGDKSSPKYLNANIINNMGGQNK